MMLFLFYLDRSDLNFIESFAQHPVEVRYTCCFPVLLWLSRTYFSFQYPIGSVHFLFSRLSERLLGKAIFLRTLQGDESHAVHWLWRPSTRQHVRPLDYHAQHDCRGHLLCYVCWPRHSSDSVFGLFTEAVSRKGTSLSLSYLQPASSQKNRIVFKLTNQHPSIKAVRSCNI